MEDLELIRIKNLERIRLTAYREVTESWRLSRLSRVVGRLDVLGCLVGQTWTSLVGIHDHKGILTASWLVPPTQLQQALLLKAWEAEGEQEVEHKTERKQG